MKKIAFTLAEVLMTLMIIGIIASITIPALFHDTNKKEQITMVKKGFSALNQAVTMHYSLTQQDLGDAGAGQFHVMDGSGAWHASPGTLGIMDVFQSRMNVVKRDDAKSMLKTQDGLTYFFFDGIGACSDDFDKKKTRMNDNNELETYVSYDTACARIVVSPLANPDYDIPKESGTPENGYFSFHAGRNIVKADSETEEYINK